MAGVPDAEASPPETANRDGETPVVDQATTTDETTVAEAETELERTIGLSGGIAIGVGTMIGAGAAGPAAVGSFTIGPVVALPTSKLATVVAHSGDGY